MAFKRIMLAGAIAFVSASATQPAKAQDQCEGYSLIQAEGMCPKPTKPFCKEGYTLMMGGSGNKLTSECVKNDETEYSVQPEAPRHNLDRFKQRIRAAKKDAPSRGRKYLWNEMVGAKEAIRTWSEQDVQDLITKLNGNLNDEERKIYKGALKYWPTLKYHADRLGVDPRLVYLVSITESRMIQEKGRSGEVSIMQVMPKTAQLVYDKHGSADNYLRHLKKTGKDWRKDKDAMIILGIYYLKDCIRAADAEGLSFNQLTEKQTLHIYYGYNKGAGKEMKATWQLGNFSACAKAYMKLYPLVEKFVDLFIEMHVTIEKKEAVLASKPKTPEKAKKKEALVKKLDSEIAKQLVAAEAARLDAAKKAEERKSAEAKKAAEKKAAKEAALAKAAKEEAAAKEATIVAEAKKAEEKRFAEAKRAAEEKAAKEASLAKAAKEKVKAETIMVKAPKAPEKSVAVTKPESAVVRAVNPDVNAFADEIRRMKAEQAALMAQIQQIKRERETR